ncbi:uncharacterized protein [Rutidosis leptorrhynchoides]|uniref:uncharacterized protein isoform X1 n=1 Tax=Rutidosis leptorrhynchoides TaxID=125765 RepID=UPI003A9A543D
MLASKVPKSSFITIVEYNASTTQAFPAHWVKYYYTNSTPEGPVYIRTPNGYCAAVHIDCVGDKLCFGSGWSTVMADLLLEPNDILCFTVIDQYNFEILMFGRDDCQKNVPATQDPMFAKCFSDEDCKELRIPADLYSLPVFSNRSIVNVINLDGSSYQWKFIAEGNKKKKVCYFSWMELLSTKK